MTEKNRDILSNAIKNMGKRSPKASNWDDIAGRLDQIDASAFSSRLNNDLPTHRAPADAWGKIIKGLPPAVPSFIGSLTGKIISGFIIVAALTTTYMFLPEKDNETAEKIKEVSVVAKEKDESEPANDNTPLLAPSPDMQSAMTSEEEPAKNLPGKDQSLKASVVSADATKEHSDPGLNENPDNAETSDQAVIGKPSTSITDKAPGIAGPGPEKNISSSISNNTKTLYSVKNYNQSNSTTTLAIERIKPVSSVSIRLKSFNSQNIYTRGEGRKKDFTPLYYDEVRDKVSYGIGAYYGYSRFQQLEQEGMKVPNSLSSFGIELKLEKHRWFLKTGIEYKGWEEKGTYNIDYSQNQLVYAFDYVDSTHINTSTGTITYFTSEREVYDSTPGQMYDEVSYQYRMLQVPILIGYKILDRAKFSLSVIGGIGFDIRLSGKQFTPVFNEQGATITGIRNNLKYRTNTNWRLIGGIELGYRLSGNWEVYVEPSCQHYMKPLYSTGHAKGIGSFKLKAGLRFCF